MNKLILAGAVAIATLTAGAAMAQPYGGYGGYRYDDRGRYGGYDRAPRHARHRDSDRDGIPDRLEWNRDRDRDGVPDQWDRYDNRRGHRYGHLDRPYRYDRRDRGYRW